MEDILRGRQTALALTNRGSANVVAGDVVILDSTYADSFILTSTAGLTTDTVGVALESITTGSLGRICIGGYVPNINLSSFANLGDTFGTTSVVKQAVPHSSITDGDFGQVLGTGTTPPASLWGGLPKQSGASLDGWTATNKTWSYASADSPTFVMSTASNVTGSYSAGMRLKLTQTTDKYFIITGIGYAAPNTSLTMYGGTDYTLTSGTIVNSYYSPHKAPLGFPVDPLKWSVEVTDTSDRAQASPVQNTWYNLGSLSISIPIGAWRLFYHATLYGSATAGNGNASHITLSTGNNTESDALFTGVDYVGGAAGFAADHMATITKEKFILTAIKVAYYLNAKTSSGSATDLRVRGNYGTTIIRAVCAYL